MIEELSELDLPDWSGDMTDDLAYIKRESHCFQPIYVVYDSDGSRLAQASTRQEAILWAEQNDLVPSDAQ